MYYIFAIVLYLFTALTHALTLTPDAPSRYIVQPGDTLWGIASHYLQQPWEWRALWEANPKIKNPSHLYPGAILELRYHQKNPYLKVLSNGTIKLSPYMRPTKLDNPIPTIPLSDIRPFLNASVVLDRDTITNAPYIVAFTTEHLLGSQGDEVYVKNLCPATTLPRGVTLSYAIYRLCVEYHDPVTQCLLGYKAVLVGYAELVRGCDPATILLTDILLGVQLLDRVLPNDYPDFDLAFYPRTPAKPIDGTIIDIPGDYTQGAVGLVTVINRGKDAGLQPGDVLAIYNLPDPALNPRCPECVKLPPERIGEAMVFRTFTRTSFALVMRSIRSVKIMDRVANP